MDNQGRKTDRNAAIAIGILAVAALILLVTVVVIWVKCFILIGKMQEDNGGNKTDIFEQFDDKDSLVYEELRDDIRTDLDYSIQKEYIEYDGEEENVSIDVNYPVLSGNVPNIDYINEQILDEYYYYEEYFLNEYKEYMTEESYFTMTSTGYVTYMDDDVISIVFKEYMDCDFWELVNLYCLNIDVHSGVILDNTEIMNLDDDFAIDFRTKYGEQIEEDTLELDDYSDQEISEMLNDPSYLILFYTPVGMEVGLNFDYGYATISYPEYEQYLKQF